MSIKKPVVLVVLDGWGYRPEKTDNAIAEAQKPFFDYLWASYPHTVLDASEENVGLPKGQPGNSEVGHMTMGAGRVIDTDLVRITKAIRENTFARNPAFVTLFKHVKTHNSVLHVMGLVSSGGVHSHQEHLFAFLRAAKEAGVTKIAIHAFTDGRDTAPQSADKEFAELEQVIADVGVGYIATACGRYFAMDRDNNWDRLEQAQNAIMKGEGIKADGKVSDVISALHKTGVTDEHLKPLVFPDRDGNFCSLVAHDGVIYFNFRADRARMLAKKLSDLAPEKDLCFVTMTEYDKAVKSLVAFPPADIQATLASVISDAGLSQAHIAETEKYAHATYFLNGGVEEPHVGEEFVLVDSRKDVATHDLAPEMKAKEITDEAIKRIDAGVDFVFVNYANADIVGHTANKPAIIKAVECLDAELKRLVAAIENIGGVAVITADHGNAETNIDSMTGVKHTAHTTNLVPCIITQKDLTLTEGKNLSAIAPTVLHLLGVPVPKVMIASSLLK